MKIEYYPDGSLKSVDGSQDFIDKYQHILPSKKSCSEESPTSSMNQSWAKWGPEFFTHQLYSGFTRIRIPLFYGLLALSILGVLYGENWRWFSWNQGDLGMVAKYAIYLLLPVGAIMAAWLPFILKTTALPTRAAQWKSLVKYVLYPIVAAILISVVIFIQKLGVTIPAPFSLSLFIGFLVLNALYTALKEASHLVDTSSVIDDG